MPNKTRYIISADRIYVIKLLDGTEIEISGLDLVNIITKRDKDSSNEKS